MKRDLHWEIQNADLSQIHNGKEFWLSFSFPIYAEFAWERDHYSYECQGMTDTHGQ